MRLSPEERAEMARAAEMAEQIPIQPRTAHKQGSYTPEQYAEAVEELRRRRHEHELAELALWEAIAEHSKHMDTTDVAYLAGLPRRTDVYSIVRALPRKRRRLKGGTRSDATHQP